MGINAPRDFRGMFRRTNQPKRLTIDTIRSRWVEAEILRCKILGMSDRAIANHLIRVAQGLEGSMVPLPAELVFPEGYRISAQAVHRACKRALARMPNFEAEDLRKIDNERLDDIIMSLRAGVGRGDPRSAEVTVKTLIHRS